MNPYKLVFHAKAHAETNGLPERPFTALYETLTAVIRDPWHETRPDPLESDEAYRYALFDGGDGVAHLRVDDQARTVTVHGVTWIG
ncbi:hypothetical protein E1264_28665 [Actinomadura sp. KC216]|uniref:hypothetical protein n=1 Tax=Actinomadura sp. KC216 TaxID=2530370 RepID=UPI001047460F|nr:hypothetical protein [Actinomadura sp. KC216]TDB83370.1 hypothetical protein E1264_28665 [Actinomadura sp. KC216]